MFEKGQVKAMSEIVNQRLQKIAKSFVIENK